MPRFDYARARAAGYTDDDIAAYLSRKRAEGDSVWVDRAEVDSVRGAPPRLPGPGGAPAAATAVAPGYQPSTQDPKFVSALVNPITNLIGELGRRTSATTAAAVAPFMEPGDTSPRQYATQLGRALLLGEVPYGLPPEGTMAEEFRRRGFTQSPIPPDVAEALNVGAQMPYQGTLARAATGPEAAGFATEMAVGVPILNEAARPIAGAARMVGRAAEPLRQLPGIRQVGRNLSPAFGIPALPENAPLGDYFNYVLGRYPSEREIVRSGLRRAAGEGALQASRREDLLQIYREGRKSLMRGGPPPTPAVGALPTELRNMLAGAKYAGTRKMTGPEADDILRTAVNEYERQGEAALQGLGPAERAAVMAARQIALDERANRVAAGLRPNELGSHVERAAQIAEERLGRARGARALAEQARTAEAPNPFGEPPPETPRGEMRLVPRGVQYITPQQAQERAGETFRQSFGPAGSRGVPPLPGPPPPETATATVPEAEAQRLAAGAAEAERKARMSLQRVERWGGIGFPRGIESRRIDLPEAERMLAERGTYPVGYDPRILSQIGRETEGIPRYGTPTGLSTGLGPRRSTFYHEPTSDVEARLLEKARQQGTLPRQSGFGAATEDRPRYFQPMLRALEQHGERADRALEHGTFLQFMAENRAVPAGPGTRPLSELPVLSGFEKNTKAALAAKHFSEPDFRFMEQIARAYEPKSYNAIGHAARQSLNYWKPMVTLLRPEFWVRNWAWSKFIQGAYGNLDPRNDAAGISLVTATHPEAVHRFAATGPVTERALRDEFIRNRIIGGSRAMDIGRGGPVGGGLGPAYQAGEDALRASYAVHLLRRGKTMEETALGVKNLMFNYGPEAFTPFLQNVRGVGAPFLAWAVNIPKLTGRALGERPGSAFGALGTLAGDVQQAAGIGPEDRAAMGKTLSERGGFAYSQPDAEGWMQGLTYSPIGFGDVNQWFPRPYHEGPLGPAQGPADAAMTSLNPGASALASLMTGRNFLGGYQYREGVPVRLPSWTAALAGAVPGIQIEPTSGQPYGDWRIAQALQLAGPVPNIPFDIGDPRWSVQMSAIKAITGIPLTRVNPERERRYQKLGERAQREEERGQKKGTRRFIRRLEQEAP